MGVLDGIRVLDLGHHIAGPLVARLLADHGADVVRIDRPGAADTRRDAYLHGHKRRIELDLKDPADSEVARSLAARSDVVVENFRPGVAVRLGLGATELREANPGLVYASLPGFSELDPRAQVPGWEGVIAAATGNCRTRVGEAPEDWDRATPTYPSLPLASNFAAILASTAIVAALDQRTRTGAGARIEVPLFDATFELIGGAGAYSLRRGFRIEDPLIVNGSGTYECADGGWVQFNPIGSTTRFLAWFLDAAGRSGWIAEGLTRPSVLADPERAAELRSRLAELFRTRTADEWERLGQSTGVPLCRIRSAAEWVETQHARQSGQVSRVDDPEFGPTWVAGSPILLTGAPAKDPQPRHLPGADREEILALLAEPPRPAADATAAPLAGAFAGLTVLDLTQILAGPSAGRQLVEYGAAVVKVNSPQRPIEAHGIVNRGKRSLLLDVQRSAGQDIAWRLIDTADVVTQNFPQGTAERYGIGYRHVAARRPDVVYVSVSCYGYGGPWSRGRGYEVQGQAVTGIMERTGRGWRPAVLGPYNPLDYGTGAMAGLAAVLGLFHRTRTGEGQHVSTSLAQVGSFHQAGMLAGAPAAPESEPAGREALGISALQRFYRASDGWIFVGARPDQAGALALATGVAIAGDADLTVGGPVARDLADAIGTAPAAAWIADLRTVGIGAHDIVRLPELLEVPYVRDTGLGIRQLSPEAGEVALPGPAVLAGGIRIAAGAPASVPGADAAAVLGELGLADRLPELETSWVVQVAAPPPGWPI